jgi:hypothetical protein
MLAARHGADVPPGCGGSVRRATRTVMSWHVIRRVASADASPDKSDEYLDGEGHWTRDRAAAHPFQSARDAWVVCCHAESTHARAAPVPTFSIGEPLS